MPGKQHGLGSIFWGVGNWIAVFFFCGGVQVDEDQQQLTCFPGRCDVFSREMSVCVWGGLPQKNGSLDMCVCVSKNVSTPQNNWAMKKTLVVWGL